LQTPIQTPLPGPGETPSYNIPTGPSDYSSGNDTSGNADLKGGRTGPYMVKFNFCLLLRNVYMLNYMFSMRMAEPENL
jgi:hypothetical protein